MFKLKNILILVITFAELISIISATVNVDGVYSFDQSYICTIQTGDAITTENEEIIVNGIHLDGYTDSNVEILNYYATTTFVPSKVLSKFTNVKYLKIEYAQLTNISTNSFADVDCSSLLELTINANNIQKIEANFAQSCVNLEKVLFYYDEIETVDKLALNGLVNLKLIAFLFNKIKFFDPETFQTSPNLEIIQLHHNQLLDINSYTFANLPHLGTVDVSYNNLTIVGQWNLTGTSNLRDIHMNNNTIIAIDRNFTENFPGDNSTNWSLNLDGNSCTNVTGFNFDSTHPINLATCNENYDYIINQFAVLAKAQSSCSSTKECRYYLDYDRKYTCVLESVDYVLNLIGGTHLDGFTDKDVKNVYLYNSSFAIIPPAIFETFPNVEFLSVKGTGMTTFNEDTLEVCGENLVKLDASFNSIDRVYDKSFQMCTSLEIVDFSNNKIQYINGGLYQSTPSLKNVILARDPATPSLP